MNAESNQAAFFPTRPSPRRNLLWIAGAALVYFLVARFSLLLVIKPEGIAAIWPASGIFLCTLLLTRDKLRPWLAGALFISDFFAELLAGTPGLISLFYALALTAEAVLGTWLLLRFVGGRISFRRVREVGGWLLLSVLLSNALAALVAAAAASRFLPGTSFWVSWREWAAADGIGNLIVTPLILGWAAGGKPWWGKWKKIRILEGAFLLLLLAFLNYQAFNRLAEVGLFSLLFTYLSFPFLIWAAIRFELRGVAAASVMVAAMAVYYASQGNIDILSPGSRLDVVITVQLYLGILVLPALLLAALMTERKQVEAALRASEDKFKHLFEDASVGKSLTQVTGEISVNRAFCDLLGYTREELYKIKWQELTHPDDIALTQSEVDRLLSGENEAARFTKRYLHRNGSIVWADVSTSVRRDEAGKPLYFMTTIIDISERKWAEQTLRESENKYQTLVEAIPAITYVDKADGSAVSLFVSPQIESILGVSRQEWIQGDMDFWIDMIHPEDRERVKSAYQHIIDSGQDFTEIYRMLARDGRMVWIDDHAILLRDTTGKPASVQGVMFDISERRQAEDALQQSNAALRKAQQVAHVGSWTWYIQSNRLEWSDEMYHIFGIEKENFSGDLVEVIQRSIHPDDRAAVEAANLSVAKDHQPVPLEYRVIWPDASVHVVWAEGGELVLDEAGKSYSLSGIVQDITARKEVEQTLRASELRYRDLFEDSPVSLWEEDFSAVKRQIEAMKQQGVTDFRTFFENHPDRLAECVQKIRVLDVNKATLALLHASSKARLVGNLKEIIRIDPAENFLGEFMCIAEGKTDFEWEGINYTLDDEAIMISLHWSVAPGYEDSLEKVLVSIINITERRQAEQKILESEASLQEAQHVAQLGSWQWSAASDTVKWSEELYRINGRDPGLPAPGFAEMSACYTPESWERLSAAVTKAMAGGESYELDLDILRPDGTLRHTFSRGMVDFDADGRIVGLHGTVQDITERKQAEARLQASEERFRSLYENATIGIYRTTPGGQILMANPALVRMLGYDSFEQLSRRDLTREGYEPEYARNKFQQQIEQDGKVHSLEAAWKCKDGRFIFVRESAHLVRDEKNQPLYYEGTVEDITERKQTQTLQEAVYRIAEAAETTASLDDLFARIHQIIASVMPAENFFIALYDAANDMLQFSYFKDAEDEQYVGGIQPAKGLTAYVLRTGRSLLCTQTVHDELERQGEVKLLGTPSAIWLGVPLVVEGKTIGAMVVQHYTDPQAYGEREQHMLEFVSSQVGIAIERKRVEETLRENEQRLASIYAAVGDVLFYLSVEADGQYRFSSVNPAFLKVTGLESGQVTGKKVSEVIPQPSLSLVLGKYHQAIQEKGIVRWEETSDYPSGRVVGEVSIAPIIDNTGKCTHLVGSVHDITGRKRAEQQIRQLNASLEQRVEERTRELKQAQEKLVRQERLAVLGQLAGGVSHELRNPLGVINTSIYYLNLVQPQASEKIKRHHAMIQQEVHNAEKIISDLLDYARNIRAERQPVEVDKLVRQTLERFPVPETVELRLEIPADLPEVFADPRQVEQVLGNLVTNACQAMSPNGGVLRLSAALQNNSVAISIQDTGTGITPENMGKLFEPLFTTKAKGIGLGLAVSQKLAEANAGRIEVQSEPGVGSTFTLWLPVQPEGGPK